MFWPISPSSSFVRAYRPKCCKVCATIDQFLNLKIICELQVGVNAFQTTTTDAACMHRAPSCHPLPLTLPTH